jgi:transcriptional regulator of acetoin/glycerol metabolism
VARHATSSFADIEIATLRLVAFHHAGNVHQAAARLGLSHVALGKWLKLRGLVR